MKKQVLVSVDRGETRVALLEATGTVAARKSAPKSGTRRRRKPAKPARRVPRRRAVPRAPRSALDRRKHLQGHASTTCSAGSRRRSSTSAWRRTASCTSTRSCCRGSRRPAGAVAPARESRQITDMLKPGQEIVVQVVKDPLKTKGARLSMDLTIAGRYMVYAPYGEGVGVSRRLDDNERDRLRKEAAKLDLKGAGAIIRTAAQGATRADLERELLYLFKLNEVLAEARRRDAGAGARLPGGRPVGAGRARHLLRRRSSARSSTTPSSTTGSCRSSRAPRPSSSTTSSCGRRTRRCSRRSGSSRCSTRRCRGGSTCPAAAT